jgi:hypothetical protein
MYSRMRCASPGATSCGGEEIDSDSTLVGAAWITHSGIRPQMTAPKRPLTAPEVPHRGGFADCHSRPRRVTFNIASPPAVWAT